LFSLLVRLAQNKLSDMPIHVYEQGSHGAA
jgi:hypothetical protein